MASQPRLPVLPHGNSSVLSGLSETFAFHSSPESFITARVLAFQTSNPLLADARTPIRAKVLNRNVAVISSYKQVHQMLRDENFALSAVKAYDELMAPFFPPPNLLLTDPPNHQSMKDVWTKRIMQPLPAVEQLTRFTVIDYFRGFKSGVDIDLYESMKELSWRIILGMFTSASGEAAAEIEALQEDLLRGQFSLFPVSINTGLWQSPRTKGKNARKKLQSIFNNRVTEPSSGCPFDTNSKKEVGDVASHLLLFTSSLAVKSLASLLTALLLNMFVYVGAGRPNDEKHPFEKLDPKAAEKLLMSTLLETERLSPPVVGVMRRTAQDVTLLSDEKQIPDTLIPKAWDVWLYFVGAGRDPAVYGNTADLFQQDRYMKPAPKGLAYGAGPKFCLGHDLMETAVMTVAKTFLGLKSETSESLITIALQGDRNDIPQGVQGWLGWQQGVKPADWARDMKQLPTQRPLKPIMMKLAHNLGPES